MEVIEEIGEAFVIFGFIAFCVWVTAKKRQAEKQMLFDMQKLILDKIGSGPEAMQFLVSEQGKEYFERLKSSEKTRGAAAYSCIYGTMIWGMVATGVGVGFFVAAHLTKSNLVIPGGISLGVGIALLIASGISYRMSKKWGLIQKEATGRSGSHTS